MQVVAVPVKVHWWQLVGQAVDETNNLLWHGNIEDITLVQLAFSNIHYCVLDKHFIIKITVNINDNL